MTQPNASDPNPDQTLEALALKLLAAREHSRLELSRKLETRGFDRAEIDTLLDRLTASGALDESRLAQVYVAERIRKGFGPLRIRAELQQKGLDEASIEPYIKDMAEEWPRLLAAAHDRRFGTGPAPSRADFARRGRFLEQRGFPADMIRRHLRCTD